MNYFLASKLGFKDIIRILLEKSCDVNFAFEENGKTPLIFASSNADTYINSVENILNYKADVFLTDKHGKNGLIYGL